MRVLPLLLLASLAGCVAAPAPRPAPAPITAVPRPAPVPVATPAPPPADWRDWPLTAGEWRYAGGIATFGAPGQTRLRLACAGDRGTLILTQPGARAGATTLRTTSMARTLAATAGAEGAQLALPVRDPAVDAMGFSRGRFVLEQPGIAPLVVPAAPEILRVAEDCRG